METLHITRPAGVDKYILLRADHAYLIYDRNTVRCTRKNEKVDISANQLNHGQHIICTACNKRCNAITKKISYGRKGLKEFGRVLWFTAGSDAVYAQLDEYTIDYTNESPEVTYNPVQKYMLAEKCERYEKKYLNRDDYIARIATWVEAKRISLPHPQTLISYDKTILYTWNLDELQVGALKYADTQGLAKLVRWDSYEYLQILYQWTKSKSIELLYKAGFTNIVWNRAKGEGSQSINWRGKTLNKILKAPPAEVKRLRKFNPTIGELERWKEAKAILPELDPKYLPLVCGYGTATALREISEVTNPYKALEYIQSRGITARDYRDHVDLVVKTDQRQNNKTMYPDDFFAEHDRLTALLQEIGDKEKTEAMAKVAEKIEKLSYSSGAYIIIPAKCPADLVKESRCLSHCVKTYTDRIAGGRTYIFFIRAKDYPEVPFYTLELSPKLEVIQCRGDHNCSPTEEVKKFVTEWETFIKKKGAA